jgi:hypothetical protein
MQPSPIAAQNPQADSSRAVAQSMEGAERAYLGSTIAAMVLLLASLWLFR